MIHETLKSGGGITETKGHDQELIAALMSVKCSIGNAFLFHMYMVISRTKVNFGKVLSPTEFIQKVIYYRNKKFSLMVSLLRAQNQDKYVKFLPS